MNNKPRPDSPWNNLTPEQREKLEGWLFEEGLTYRETLERAEKEFGFSTSITSLAGYYHRICGERQGNSITETIEWFNENADNPGQSAKLSHTIVRLIEVKVCEMAMAEPEKFKAAEFSRLMKLLLAIRQQSVREKINWGNFLQSDAEPD